MGMVVVYCLAVMVAFHLFIESYRLRARASKVGMIEEGDADRLFEEIDINGDGRIHREELSTFLLQSGIDGEVFEKAFDNIDSNDENKDGDVNAQDLIDEFTWI